MPRSELAPGTGELIRSYLRAKGGGSSYGAYRFLVRYLEEEYGGGYRPPTYDSTRQMFWVMKKLGLIAKVGELPIALQRGIRRRHPTAYYAIVPQQAGSQAWRDPKLAWQAAFSPNEENRRTYARRWNKIQQLPRLELYQIDDERVRIFVNNNRL